LFPKRLKKGEEEGIRKELKLQKRENTLNMR
jgi:hypothetical protein